MLPPQEAIDCIKREKKKSIGGDHLSVMLNGFKIRKAFRVVNIAVLNGKDVSVNVATSRMISEAINPFPYLGLTETRRQKKKNPSKSHLSEHVKGEKDF